jgi:mycothiol synthase
MTDCCFFREHEISFRFLQNSGVTMNHRENSGDGMRALSLTIRNYRPADFEGCLRLHRESESFDRQGRYVWSRTLAAALGRPNCCPEKNAFVVEKNKKIVAFMGITPETGIRRVLLDGLVHPHFRRKGVATALFSHAMQRARDLGANVMHISIQEANAAARNLVSKLGFKFIRYFLQLKLDLENTNLPDVRRGPFVIRKLRSGEEDILTRLQNRSFAGSWGFNPNTTEEIVHRVNLSRTFQADVMVACEGDRHVGYCWTRINTEENRPGGEKKGQIHMMGVHPDYRRKGIGKALLVDGLERLKARGVGVVELTVDSENTAARLLYTSAGFELEARTEWYERRVK